MPWMPITSPHEWVYSATFFTVTQQTKLADNVTQSGRSLWQLLATIPTVI
ncbi:hypothetical protein QWZ13_06810 [Reinekea marina]|nr:hypothetical protein [Reinekea marina]MDN3648621.1 hypothetical protein [Reinekea marina]